MNELFLSSLLPLQLVRARGDFYMSPRNHRIALVHKFVVHNFVSKRRGPMTSLLIYIIITLHPSTSSFPQHLAAFHA